MTHSFSQLKLNHFWEEPLQPGWKIQKSSFHGNNPYLSWPRHILDRSRCVGARLQLRWVEEAGAYRAGSLVDRCMPAERTCWEHTGWAHNDWAHLSSPLFLPRTLWNNRGKLQAERKHDRSKKKRKNCLQQGQKLANGNCLFLDEGELKRLMPHLCLYVKCVAATCSWLS